MKINQKGFSIIEVLIVLAIIGVIGTIGWLVYDRQNKIEPTSQNSGSSTTAQESPDAGLVVPDGWIKFESKYDPVTFYYPESWDSWDYPEWTDDDNEFEIRRASIHDRLYPRANQGGYYYFDTDENIWYAKEGDGDINPKPIEHFKATSSPQINYPILHGMTGEGGGEWYVILITDGKYAYQITSPLISGDLDTDYHGKIQELEDNALQVIQSIRFP